MPIRPAGIPYGHGHYGWAIHCIVFTLSVFAGILLEWRQR